MLRVILTWLLLNFVSSVTKRRVSVVLYLPFSALENGIDGSPIELKALEEKVGRHSVNLIIHGPQGPHGRVRTSMTMQIRQL